MHASASPFEALAERLNWMKAKLEDDPFGAAMLSSGIPKDTIMAWTKDPQEMLPCGHTVLRAAFRYPTHARWVDPE